MFPVPEVVAEAPAAAAPVAAAHGPHPNDDYMSLVSFADWDRMRLKTKKSNITR